MAAARHALITGGHGALAQALAAELQAAGYHVLAPGHAELDVCSADSVSAYFNQLGKLDLLINNAGVRHDALLVRMTTEAWNQVLQTNLHGARRCAQAIT